MYAIATGKAPTPLAVQEVIDCAYPNWGCSGGDTCVALDWMTKAVYPLRDESDFCTIITNKTRGIKVFVKGLPEDRLLELLQSGPVVAAVDAKTWQNYQGGIIQYHCESHINHAVQIVGYDLTGPVPYYIVRNSWGTDFGHSGYLYIKVGDNLCGIAEEVSTVSVYL
ncbi:CATO-like protein [Mya arenaria]|uniref:CATO-like protein n=1 Tax=Mya arenaria TaxID=6604 RepID=A0ABY7DP50_MYAAR|nr:CATO-like protein [Mya arenaria]